MKRATGTLLALLALALPGRVAAEGEFVVEGDRVELGEIAAVKEPLRSLDLGPAPPPGGTLVLDRDLVAAQIRAAGHAPDAVPLARVLRVVGASRRLTQPELTAFVSPAIARALPRGVTLTHAQAQGVLVTAPDAEPGRVEVPKPPKRAGLFKTAVVVPIVVRGAVVQRVSVAVTLDVSDAAATPDVLRGSRVTLVIERRSARVGASGIALRDTDIGTVGEFRVENTGRVVRARLDGTDLASVVFP